MPAISNMVVKAANGTSDVTLNAVQPAGNDGQPAVFRENAAAGANGHKPIFQIATRWNGPKTARRATTLYKGHQTFVNSTTGLTEIANTLIVEVNALVPVSMPTAVADEHIARAVNANAHLLTKQSFSEGYAPT